MIWSRAAGPRYTVASWPTLRNAVASVLAQHRPHTYYGLCEAEVTEPLARLRVLTRRAGCALSFHAYVLHALAQAAAEHPGVLTYRWGRRLVTFGDVDVSTTIDKRFPGGVRLPAVYTVRAAQSKSLAKINWELRKGVREDQGAVEAVRLRRGLARMPRPVRALAGLWMGRDPFLLGRLHGNIGLTSLHSQGLRTPFFALPPNIHTVTIAVGGIFERREPSETGGARVKKVMCLAGGADHLVIDGMPLSRFTVRLVELLESGQGLDDALVDETRALRAADRP